MECSTCGKFWYFGLIQGYKQRRLWIKCLVWVVKEEALVVIGWSMASLEEAELSEAYDLARFMAVDDKSWWEATWFVFRVRTLVNTDEFEALVDFGGSMASLDVVEFSEDLDLARFMAFEDKSWWEATWSELGVNKLIIFDEFEALVDLGGSMASWDVVEFSGSLDFAQSSDWDEFKQYRTLYKSTFRSSINAFFKEATDAKTNDPAKIWKTVKSKISPNPQR